jgi:hypothetical protein
MWFQDVHLVDSPCVQGAGSYVLLVRAEAPDSPLFNASIHPGQVEQFEWPQVGQFGWPSGFCGRNARIKLLKASPEKLGRYGDEQAPRPVGVFTTSEAWTSPIGIASEPMAAGILWEIKSSRQEWEIVQGARKPQPAGEFSERVQPSPPWTSVNNCTYNQRVRLNSLVMSGGILTSPTGLR